MKKPPDAQLDLVGWSWGAMTAGYYASLYSEKVNKLVLYAPAYAFAQHTNLGAGTQNVASIVALVR